MKKRNRIISILLTAAILLSLLPTSVLAANDVMEISTAAQLVELGGKPLNNAEVVLTADIDMQGQTMSPITSIYRSTFDGAGRKISNLTIEASNSAGLFAELSGSSRITGLIMENCSVTQTGGSYTGAGMLVGKVSGSGSVIDACGVVGGTVKNESSLASHVGGLVGRDDAGITLSGCFSTANVKAGNNSSSRTGGLLGSATDSTLVENCYALSTVEAGSGSGGGLVGYGYGSYSNHAVIRNSYASADVNGTGSCYSLCNAYNYTDFENCFYNSERTFGIANDETGVAANTGAELKAAADAMGGAFQADLETPVNDGFPILKWQDPNATYSYTMTVKPADAKVTWDGAVQEAQTDGVYTFTGMASGTTHTYKVEQGKAEDDYAPQSGSITIGKADGAKTVTLEANRYELTFTLDPADAVLQVKSGDTVLEPESGHTYSVTNGTYHYTAEKFGFETAEGDVVISKAGQTKALALIAQPAQTVTFQYGELVCGKVQSGALTVQTGENVIAPKEDGGMVYELPKGYTYTYTFKSANYAKVTDVIDLTGEASDAQTVTLPMAEKTAWGGADDILKPAGEGTEASPYLIGTGAELAWLAQEVNSAYGSTAHAVLTKDIDLGDEVWSPIGTNTSHAFKGYFDGAGHEVRGLFLDNTDSTQGLFGTVDGGHILDLTVAGTITGGNQTGGVTGELKGSALIERCINEVRVEGKTDVGGIAGKINGSKPTIRECVNHGAVTGNYSVGGIVGQLYYGCLVDSCYSTGAIEARNEKAGGIAGYSNDGSATVQNCYAVGSVNSKSLASAVIGKKSSGTAENLYYLDTLPADANATAKTAAELQAGAALLGSAFQSDMTDPINGGYPILKWQDTTPRYTVTLTVPADAVLTVTNSKGAAVGADSASEGVYTFNLTDGTYNYEVKGFGYVTKTGSFTVSGTTVTETLTPEEAARQAITFTVTPDAAAQLAKITVKLGDRVIEPTGDAKAYSLPDGTYDYVIKAKGYTKVTGQLTVSGKAETVTAEMTVSLGWDGETQEPVTPNGEGIYEISTGEELAWFAAQVNSGTGKSWNAKLTADIDLGDYPWTPIGKNYSYLYAGQFDGAGFTVSGLKAEARANDAGLFGYVKGSSSAYAEIRNLTVAGTVNTSAGFAGGIVGQGAYLHIADCRNEVNVTATGNTGSIGGIIGAVGDWDEGTVVNCTNSGTISAPDADKVGGITGYNSYTSITGCYNTGSVTGKQNVGGVVGSASGPVTNVYNTGAVTGASGNVGGLVGYVSTDVKTGYNAGTVTKGATQGNAAFGQVSSYSGSAADCYYLVDCGAEDFKAVAKTEEELQGLTGVLNAASADAWKQVAGVNNNYPILSWQKDKPAAAEKINLAKAQDVRWQADEAGNLTTLAAWSPVENAESYTVVLWKYALEQSGEYTPDETEAGDSSGLDYVTLTYKFTPVLKREGIKTTSCEFGAEIKNAGTASYCVSVTPIAAEGSDYIGGVVPENETQLKEQKLINLLGSGVLYEYTTQLSAPEHLRWIGNRASWDEVPGADGYLVSLYTLDQFGRPQGAASGIVNGDEISLDCASYFTVGRSYVFTVQALSMDETQNSEVSLVSNDPGNKDYEHGVYMVETLPQPDPGEETDRTGWIAISTAQQWMDLANIPADLIELPDGTHTNNQAVEWAKKYYLTADLDFSQLGAAQGTKTKSLGNAANTFTGIFDGNGHKITGLTLSNFDSGLFGYIGGQGLVKDLVIENANVLFSDNAAVLAYSNKGTIQNCGVLNSNITADVGAVLGGMISRNSGIIRNSWVEGGKLVSHTDKATGHAGFVGANENGGLIENCWTSMDISTQSSYAGGFVGLGYGGTIRNCFALGDVSARDYSGGFAGRSVYDGNCYENCYAAGKVTVSSSEGHGFIAPSKPDSAFHPDVRTEVINCYYNEASPADSFAAARSLTQMRSSAFLKELKDNNWAQAPDKNNGLPFLNSAKIPAGIPTTEITVEIAVASYDKNSYTFKQMGNTVSVTMESTGNTNVVDLMDAAASQGKLSYSYDTSVEFGRFIHTINGRAVTAPDGWMFTIDDQLSNVSASLATVTDGAMLLWFEGTTENHFQGPTWAELSNQNLEWTNIGTVDQLLALAASQDDTVLATNYRLTADLDLKGQSFNGIGSAAHPFTGRFDGQKHTVSNMTLNGNENVGFFNVLKDAEITNLKLTDVKVTGVKNVGGLVGWAQVTLDTANLSKNTACLVGSCSVSGAVSGKENAGGLMGLNDGKLDTQTYFSSYSTVDKCKAHVTVTGNDHSASKLGGLVGNNAGIITKSSATGNVTAAEGSMVGGLTGINSQEIYDSHAEGDVNGSTGVGGFAGISTGKVKHSYSLGAVSGKEKTGSFAGSLGAADTVVGAGQVTKRPGGMSGYVAGLAGMLNGKLSGVEFQITVKNAYGNCVQSGGTTMKVIGNEMDFPGDTDNAILTEMALNTNQAVSDKLMELFGVNMKVSANLKTEASKYADAVLVPNTAEVGAQLSLLKTGETADSGVTVTYETAGTYVDNGLKLVKANDKNSTLTVPVTVILEGSSGVFRKDVSILLQAPVGTVESVMDAIAATYPDSSEGWTVLDMALYAALDGKTHKTTEEARQNALNLLIGEAANADTRANGRSRIELVLRAMGIDSNKLYPTNSNSLFSNAAKLTGAQLDAATHYDAPWILLADLQGNLKLSDDRIDQMIKLLQNNMGPDGMFSYQWGGVTYTSPDMAGATLSALARFYNTRPQAKLVIDTILEHVPTFISTNGSLGNANSDAMMIIGLIAMGKDPADYQSVSGASLVDGLLSSVNASGDGFLFMGDPNAMATEQGFRALVALQKFQGQPLNIYDFSANPVKPGRATGDGEVTKPEEPHGPSTINVSFQLKSDTNVWVPTAELTLKEGSTVYHAFKMAADKANLTYAGAEAGYVSSITNGNITLGEFTKGPNSGWLYKVNGELPQVALTACTLKDGDSILFYYITDWKKDPDAGSVGGSTDGSVTVKKPQHGQVIVTPANAEKGDKVTLTVKPDTGYVLNELNVTDAFGRPIPLTKKNGEYTFIMPASKVNVQASFRKLKVVFTDVPADAYCAEAVRWAVENGITLGATETTFAPNAPCTRGHAVTFLWRASGSPAFATEAMQFMDVDPSSYCAEAVHWAAVNCVTNGTTNSHFSPNAPCTRGQIVTLLWRAQGRPSATGDLPFTDVPADAYCAEAVRWAVENRVTMGITDTTFAPNAVCTRGQIVTLLYRALNR